MTTAHLAASPPTPVGLDLVIQSDVVTEIWLTWTDPAGAVVDLTGYSARLRFRAVGTGEVGLSTITTATDAGTVGRILLDAVTPNMKITVPSPVTSALSFRREHHVLEVTDPAGITRRWAEGDVRLDRAVGF